MATTQSLGRVSIMPKGEFDESTQYERLDLVEYNGSSYLALKTSVGNLPTDSNYFQLIAEKGDTGATGATGATGQTGATGRGVSSIVMSNEGTSHPITAIYSDSTEETIGTIKDGSGGDMYKADYGSDTDGVVAYAKALTDGTNTVTPTTVMGKADKSTTYTKTEVDALVNGIETNWTEVQSKPFSTVSNDLSISSSGALGLTDDEKNKLGVALTSDKYSSAKTYSKDELAILNNKVYKSKVDNNLNHVVTETGYWEETTLGEELGALNMALTNKNDTFTIETNEYYEISNVAITYFGKIAIASFQIKVLANPSSWVNVIKPSKSPRNYVYGNPILYDSNIYPYTSNSTTHTLAELAPLYTYSSPSGIAIRGGKVGKTYYGSIIYIIN